MGWSGFRRPSQPDGGSSSQHRRPRPFFSFLLPPSSLHPPVPSLPRPRTRPPRESPRSRQGKKAVASLEPTDGSSRGGWSGRCGWGRRLRKVANRSSRSKELEEVQIGYKWFSKEGVCNCNRDKAMEEECVAGLCKFSPIEGQGVAASWICREEEVLVAEDGAHGKSSERHSHGGMADVKVWIVGEKVGEGVGETRKEAQTTSC